MSEIASVIETIAAFIWVIISSFVVRMILMVLGWIVTIGVMDTRGVDILNFESYGNSAYLWVLPLVLMIGITIMATRRNDHTE